MVEILAQRVLFRRITADGAQGRFIRVELQRDGVHLRARSA